MQHAQLLSEMHHYSFYGCSNDKLFLLVAITVFTVYIVSTLVLVRQEVVNTY